MQTIICLLSNVIFTTLLTVETVHLLRQAEKYPEKMDGTRCVRYANKNCLLAIRSISPAVPCASFYAPASS